jgi:hypothetical protein
MNLRRLLTEPLFHFFMIGLALFAFFALLNRDEFSPPNEIVVDSARVESLRSQFERVWKRPPTAGEMQGLIDNWIREEIMYREGLALGFDQEDPVIRRRVAQKVTFMTEAIADAEPDDAELRAWLEENEERYELDPVVSLQQVYFDPQRRGDELKGDVAAALAALQAGENGDFGDSTLLPSAIEDASLSEIERTFGREFAQSVAWTDPGKWAGPVRSGYGLHLVFVESMEAGRVPELDEVRAAVERDLRSARREEAAEAFYEAIRERYEIVIDDAVAPVAAE